MAPKVTEAHLEARRQQILEAAYTCFARDGFHQTTMQDICREAELSPGAVYRYFESKEAIIEASCAGEGQDVASRFEAAQHMGSTLETIDALLRDFFEGIEAVPAPALALNVQVWSEAVLNERVREMLDATRGTALEGLEQIAMRAQEQGEIDTQLDPKSVARVMMAAYEGLVLQRSLDPEMDVVQYAAVFRAMYGGSFWMGSGEPTKSAQRTTSDGPIG